MVRQCRTPFPPPPAPQAPQSGLMLEFYLAFQKLKKASMHFMFPDSRGTRHIQRNRIWACMYHIISYSTVTEERLIILFIKNHDK